MSQIDSNLSTIAALEAAIEDLERDTSEEANFFARTDALDLLEFPIIHQAETMINTSYGQAKAVTNLMQRALQLKSMLEGIDGNVAEVFRQKIKSSAYSREEVKSTFYTYIDANSDQRSGLAYDYLDKFVNLLLNVDASIMPQKTREPEMVFYQPTPARFILEMIQRSRMSERDVFFDLGCGLGNVVIVSALLTGATSIGVDVEPVYCDYARRCAEQLGISNACFINQDARDLNYSDGTVFFMYHPFTGRILESMLDKLKTVSEKRTIKLCTLGACSLTVGKQGWLERLGQSPCEDARLAFFVSK
jgi:hypothetical protein